MKMNLNNNIKITLTEKGLQIYKDYYRSIQDNNYHGLEGYELTIQLWKFAHIFGKELWNGNPTPPCEMSFQFVN